MLSTKLFNLMCKVFVKPSQITGLIPMKLVNTLINLMANLWLHPRFVKVTPIIEFNVQGDMISASKNIDEARVVLHLHGGGYFFCSPRTHRNYAWRLSHQTNLKVFLPRYRMAPDHTISDATADAVSAYSWLLDQGYKAENIIVGGDSAGGSLAILLLQNIKTTGLPMPKAGYFLSPFADLSMADRSMQSNAKSDPFIHPKTLRKLSQIHSRHVNGDEKHPSISPVFGSFKDFPPLMFQVGSTEVLLDSTSTTVDKAREQGISVEHNVWHEAPHVFSIYAGIFPEATKGLKEISTFVQQQLSLKQDNIEKIEAVE